MRDEGRTEEQRRVDGLLQTEKIMIWMEGTSASGEEDGVDVKLSGWMDYFRRSALKWGPLSTMIACPII